MLPRNLWHFYDDPHIKISAQHRNCKTTPGQEPLNNTPPTKLTSQNKTHYNLRWSNNYFLVIFQNSRFFAFFFHWTNPAYYYILHHFCQIPYQNRTIINSIYPILIKFSKITSIVNYFFTKYLKNNCFLYIYNILSNQSNCS